ncbi:hypothetical protein Tco_0613589 [Tanacetum coccineum]
MFLDKQVEGISKHKETYVTPSHTKKVFANMKRKGKDFSGRDTPLFPTMMVQAQEEVGEDEAANEEHVPTYSNDPLLSGEDRLKLNELMETSKTAQAQKISSLKQRVEHLEKKKKSRPHGLRRLYKEKKIDKIDQDAEVTLVDETQGRNGDNLMFDTGVLDNKEVFADPVTTAGEGATTANVEVSTARPTEATITDELTLAQILIKIKAAKPNAVTTAASITTTVVTRPKARGTKDKGKAKMIEPEMPLKKKDQIMFDKEVAQNLQAQLEAELEEEKKLARQKEEDANIF